ncbi:MAG: type II secretion system F family protein [Candidatus Obscuribacterales bacterium]|nr:type II secretion system F family protein [Candidatus Obscuribacterales bacterium]
MSPMFIGMLTFGGCIIFGLLVMQPLFTQYVDQYAVRVRPKEKEPEGEGAPKDSTITQVCRTVGELVLSILPACADRRTVELLNAGNYRTPQHLAIYIGIRSIIALGAVFLGLIASTGNAFNLILAIPTALLGWMLPNFFLAGRVKKRQALILRELPTIIDLLIVCAQAGLGLMMGVDKVSKEIGDSCPILAEEMRQLISDVKIFAKSVPIALREMGERCMVDELINMASALIAAEQKGSDIAYPLKQQAEALRDRLKRKKEEEAAKVPVKMVPVIMIFVMPLILAPMLGPAVVTIVNALGPIVGGLGK